MPVLKNWRIWYWSIRLLNRGGKENEQKFKDGINWYFVAMWMWMEEIICLLCNNFVWILWCLVLPTSHLWRTEIMNYSDIMSWNIIFRVTSVHTLPCFLGVARKKKHQFHWWIMCLMWYALRIGFFAVYKSRTVIGYVELFAVLWDL